MKAIPSGNAWFGVSLALLGVIAGYGIALGVHGISRTAVNPPPPQAARQQPPVPSAPSQPAPAPEATNVPPIDPERDHIRGEPDAMITVIEYSDFECPFCKRHHPTMKQILDAYDGKVSWIYRHYPLPFHANAQPSAIASECANELGGNDAFWRFADIIFEKGADAGRLAAYAGEIGLDAGDFQACVESGKYTQHISDDMAGGSEAGVSGTPGNIVYNLMTKEARLVSGAQPFEAFKNVIDEMLGDHTM